MQQPKDIQVAQAQPELMQLKGPRTLPMLNELIQRADYQAQQAHALASPLLAEAEEINARLEAARGEVYRLERELAAKQEQADVHVAVRDAAAAESHDLQRIVNGVKAPGEDPLNAPIGAPTQAMAALTDGGRR
jgi:predicted  nucleic acid-binding Zn-ribbon protein